MRARDLRILGYLFLFRLFLYDIAAEPRTAWTWTAVGLDVLLAFLLAVPSRQPEQRP